MDTQALILAYLQMLNAPVRLPTAQWLFSDLFGLLNCEVRNHITQLQDSGRLRVDNGGWIHV